MLVVESEAEVFERLFADHHRAVLGYALRRVDFSAAQDVVAETFLIAWRRRLDIPVAAELPWLLGVARNVARQHHRADARETALSAELARLHTLRAAESGDPGEEVGERIVVLQALADLSDADREILILTGWDLLSIKDAARVLGCSGPTLRVRLHRARTRLTRALQGLDNPTAGSPETPPTEPPPTGVGGAADSEIAAPANDVDRAGHGKAPR